MRSPHDSGAPLRAELALAVRAAHRAGSVLRGFFRSRDLAVKQKGANDPVTEADLAANAAILEEIRSAFPGDSILTEESPATAGGPRRWVVDPMDGTLEFVAGSEDFCVMIGLTIDDAPILGAIYHPAHDRMYAGVVGEGAWVIERSEIRREVALERWRVGPPLRLVHSRNHRSGRLLRLQERFEFGDRLSMGSAGLKCMTVLDGRADVYVHPSTEIKEWDTCAADAIFRAAGAPMTDGFGRELRYGKHDPRHPNGIVAAKPGLPKALWDAIREISPQ